MSRSYKKAIYKDKGWIGSRLYNRIIRRNAKQCIQQDKEIPNPKTIIDDYDRCDFIWDMEHQSILEKIKDKNWIDKLKRK